MKNIKSDPIPTRFEKDEKLYIKLLSGKKGVSGSEVIRRGIRLLAAAVKARGEKWDWIEETARPLPPIPSKELLSIEDPVQEVLDAEEARRSQAKRAKNKA